MEVFKFESQNSEETVRFGERLAKYLKRGDIIALFGDLGSGKTTLVKGIAKGLKVKSKDVNSPTFTLLNCYEGKLAMYHFDLYRLDDVREIQRLGCEEFFYADGVSIVEWAERLKELLPKEYLGIELVHKNIHERVIKITAHGKRYETLLEKLK